MLKRVVITNYLGESMEYKIDGVQVDNPSGLIITSIDGLGPSKANVNMATLTTTDGNLYNSARLEGKNIVIKGEFTHASSIEEARLLSYRYFPIKKKVNVQVYTDNRSGEINGYVESNEPDIFSEHEGCQISIVCESATFSAIGESGITSGAFANVMPLFKFPFGNASLTEKLIKLGDIAETRETVIEYLGDYETGMEIHILVRGNVESNISIFKDGDNSMILKPSRISYIVPSPNNDKFVYGDEIVITTSRGKKGVKLIRGGNEYNVLNVLEKNPDWFIFHRGENRFFYRTEDDTEDELLRFTLYAPKLYEGV